MQCRSCQLVWKRIRIPMPQRPSRSYSSASIPNGDIYDVVCVGGGPAGLSLLAGLRASPITSGLKVALVENQDLRKNASAPISPDVFSNRCSSLTPASLQFLKETGAWSHIDESRVQPYHDMQVWDGLTDARITFDWGKSPSSYPTSSSNSPYLPPPSSAIAYMIENTNLTTGLQKFLSQIGNTTIISPARVESISYGPTTESFDLSSWPTVNLSNKQSLIARLLVGADGANSPVRTFAGIQSRGWDYNRMGVVATLQLGTAPAKKTAFQRFLPTGPVAMLPLPGTMASLVWSTVPERAARLKTLSGVDFTAMVNAAFRLSAIDLSHLHTLPSGQLDEVAWREQHTSETGALPERATDVLPGTVAAFPLKMRHADTYTAERIALVGDAAHTIHPLAGQGLNQGQGDVAALIRTIEAAVVSGQDIGSSLALEQYTSERYAANNALLGVCDKLHKLYSFESGPIVPLRSWGLKAVSAMGPLKGLLMSRAAGGGLSL